MSKLPTLAEIQTSGSHSQSPLAIALELLFEHSPILTDTLEPQLHVVLKASTPLTSYAQLMDIALQEIAKWDTHAQSEFISGHPRIGESKNLSTLSANEQGGKGVSPTPPDVLARLEHLNASYEVRYPGLRYITFVDGRSRAVIAEEMEGVLSFPHSLSPVEPSLDTIVPIDIASKEWRAELQRAIFDVGRIGKSRLKALGVA